MSYFNQKTYRIASIRSACLLILAAMVVGCVHETGTSSSLPAPQLTQKDSRLLGKVPEFATETEDKPIIISDPTSEKPGSIVVDTKVNFLYFVLEDKKAIRYAISTGADAYGWTGAARIARKAEWPRWMPPASMVKRAPHLRSIAGRGGMAGGPSNPLGARALYLYQGDRDTLYRIHGTNEPDKIRLSVSSGCIRMRNIDVVDLYNRAKLEAKVIVR